jgi:hypothetical protein
MKYLLRCLFYSVVGCDLSHHNSASIGDLPVVVNKAKRKNTNFSPGVLSAAPASEISKRRQHERSDLAYSIV